ncbi:hypothetical protein, partial [Bacillus cereus]|uniref:hypothetical protein n=1 Tax=Bacillus cereus TaxID=1396 RepID=UPI003D65FBC5
DAILETARKNFIFWSGLFQYALKTVPRKNQSGFTLDLLPLDLKSFPFCLSKESIARLFV